MTTRGTYIAFEGLEGCGKSTHVTRLAEKINAVATREPGGTRIGALLRGILADPENTDLNSRTELLLMTADRAQHMSDLIEPTLQRGQHVVSDRSVYSSIAYQGYGRQLPIDTVRAVNDWALQSRWPDSPTRVMAVASTSTHCSASTLGRSTTCFPTLWCGFRFPPKRPTHA